MDGGGWNTAETGAHEAGQWLHQLNQLCPDVTFMLLLLHARHTVIGLQEEEEEEEECCCHSAAH